MTRRWTYRHPLKENDPFLDLHITDLQLAIQERFKAVGWTPPVFYYKKDLVGSNHLVWGADYPDAGKMNNNNLIVDEHLYSVRYAIVGRAGTFFTPPYDTLWNNDYSFVGHELATRFFREDVLRPWVGPTEVLTEILGSIEEVHDCWKDDGYGTGYGEHFFDSLGNSNSPYPYTKIQHINQIRECIEALNKAWVPATTVYYREKVGTLTDEYNYNYEDFWSDLKTAVKAASWGSWTWMSYATDWVLGEVEINIIEDNENWYYDDGTLILREFKTVHNLDLEIVEEGVWPPTWARYSSWPNLMPPSVGQLIAGGFYGAANMDHADGLIMKNKTTGIQSSVSGVAWWSALDSDIISYFGGNATFEWTSYNEWSDDDIHNLRLAEFHEGTNTGKIELFVTSTTGSPILAAFVPNWKFGAP